MNYVDGFIAPVKTANKAAFIEHVALLGRVFREHGALRVVDCWADDVPDGVLTSFPLAVKKESDETVAFGWVEWRSKAERDEGFQKVMADPRLAEHEPPFDGKRMIFGGFAMLAQS